MWYSGKFTCARRQFACVLREVLAASKQVNLPVFTGKLHVTQVNCARDLFTCELHVKLPAFAGNFARASFTVYFRKLAEGTIGQNRHHADALNFCAITFLWGITIALSRKNI